MIAWEDWNAQGDGSELVVRPTWCGSDDQLGDLADYLIRDQPRVDDALLPWRPGEFNPFLSHIARETRFVTELSQTLSWFGVHGFVAHEHIEPGKDRADVIRSCLYTCDAAS